MNAQAEELNRTIRDENQHIYHMLSERGKRIFFPAKGILAQAGDAKGKAINATIGMAMEDDGSPMRLESIASLLALDPAEAFPYAPSSGLPELRKKWRSMLVEKNPRLEHRPISLPVVCNALTHGLHMCGYLFVDPQDSIILPDLYWGNYNLVFRESFEADLQTFPMFSGDRFNIEGLRERLMDEGDKKVVILNFPNNPTGYTPDTQTVDEICIVLKQAAAAGKNLVVLCDDAYAALVFEEGVYRESIFAAICDLDERILAVKIDGATKEDYVWGFRVGFITYGSQDLSSACASALETKTSGAVRASISSDSRLSQSLLLKAYSSDRYASEKKQKFELIRERYEMVKKTVAEHPEYEEYFQALPYNSGYFMCFKLKAHQGESIRQILLSEYDTGVIALGNIIRIAYSALDAQIIPRLVGHLYQACKGSSNET